MKTAIWIWLTHAFFFDFFDNCPETLKEALDKRGIIAKILDWLGHLFNPGESIANNKIPAIEEDKKIINYNIKDNTYLIGRDEFSHPDESCFEYDELNNTFTFDSDDAYRENEGEGEIIGLCDALSAKLRLA